MCYFCNQIPSKGIKTKQTYMLILILKKGRKKGRTENRVEDQCGAVRATLAPMPWRRTGSGPFTQQLSH